MDFVLKTLIQSLSLWEIGLLAALGFGIIYFGIAGSTLFLTRKYFPGKGIGKVIDTRPLRKGQILRETRHSLVSIIIFGAYGALTFYCERRSWIEIDWQFRPIMVAVDLLVIYLWNEIHFYFCHWLLHRKRLYRWCHVEHHRSLVPTPFSTYSFHWFEAVLLGSVMITLLSIYSLSIYVVLFFPVVSLVLNNIGHMNYAIFPQKGMSSWLASCWRHTKHHNKIWGNYGFMIPHFDKWFGTRFNTDYEKPLESAEWEGKK